VVMGRGHGSLAAATAAGGRPPSPAPAYRPRQTRPENLPWQRRTTHPIEIKYCEDTRPEQQLQAAHAQHGYLRHSIAGDHVLHVILLGVGGVIYIPHTLVPPLCIPCYAPLSAHTNPRFLNKRGRLT